MHYVVISFSHKNTDITTREKLALSDVAKKEAFYQILFAHDTINEVVILSTCNRVEFVLSTKETTNTINFTIAQIASISGISFDELEGRADIYEDSGAVHHIFSVVSALESIVIGESQITGQLKDAYKEAKKLGFCDAKLSRVIDFSLKCAKEVRNLTDISKKPLSIASTAVMKAESVVGKLKGKSAIVVGAGEMGLIVAKHLEAKGAKIILVGRNYAKTHELSLLLEHCEAKDMSDLSHLINRYPILFSATSSQVPVIYDDMLEDTHFRRYWFDIAVPRDIDIRLRDNIELFSVDDLKDIVQSNLVLKEEQAKEAYKIVGRYSVEFYEWLNQLEIEPAIKQMRLYAKEVASAEVARAIKKGYLEPQLQEEVLIILKNTFNKFLHTPTTRIREGSKEDKTLIDSAKFIFDLER